MEFQMNTIKAISLSDPDAGLAMINDILQKHGGTSRVYASMLESLQDQLEEQPLPWQFDQTIIDLARSLPGIPDPPAESASHRLPPGVRVIEDAPVTRSQGRAAAARSRTPRRPTPEVPQSARAAVPPPAPAVEPNAPPQVRQARDHPGWKLVRVSTLATDVILRARLVMLKTTIADVDNAR